MRGRHCGGSMEAELQVETLDHLGLVAGVIDELGLVELTNQ